MISAQCNVTISLSKEPHKQVLAMDKCHVLVTFMLTSASLLLPEVYCSEDSDVRIYVAFIRKMLQLDSNCKKYLVLCSSRTSDPAI